MASTRPVGYIQISVDEISPRTGSADIDIRDATDTGTKYVRFDSSEKAIDTDKIGEFTSTVGVTIDDFLVKDGGARLLNDTFFLGLDNAGSADVDIVKLNTSDLVVFGSAADNNTTRASLGITAPAAWAPSYGAGGSMTFTTVTTTKATYFQVGEMVFFSISAIGTIGGTPDDEVTFTLPTSSHAEEGGGDNAITAAVSHIASLRVGGHAYISSSVCYVRAYDSSNWSAGTRSFVANGFYRKA